MEGSDFCKEVIKPSVTSKHNLPQTTAPVQVLAPRTICNNKVLSLIFLSDALSPKQSVNFIVAPVFRSTRLVSDQGALLGAGLPPDSGAAMV